MKDKNIIPSIFTYNSMIAGFCRTGKTDKAIDLLNELLGNGLFPDETTYNTIIHGYCWEKQIEKAFQFHNKMVENSFKPDVFTCNILLRGLSTGGMLDKALKLFHTWISKGKQVDLVTYNTIISSLCRERRFEEAFALVADMEEKGLDPDCYTYNAIITALTDAGRIDDFEDFVSKRIKKDDMEAQSLQLDRTQNEGTIKTCPEMDQSSISYSEKISKLCGEGKYKDALEHFQESREKSIMLQKSAYIHLMSGLIRRRKRTSEAG
ncbi:Pentatricopeptide repeat-containing protein At2g16880 [Linum perenne]